MLATESKERAAPGLPGRETGNDVEALGKVAFADTPGMASTTDWSWVKEQPAKEPLSDDWPSALGFLAHKSQKSIF